MKKTDKMLSAIILGSPAPVSLILLFWWSGVLFNLDNNLLYILLVLSGLAAGIILDITVLRWFVFRLFSLSMPSLFIICTFYSIMIYGMFMGFPVFNSLIGIAGTYIVIRKSIVMGDSKEKLDKNTRLFFFFSFLLLLVICIITTLMALNEASIGKELELMLNLKFEVTKGMIWTLILVGGSFLLGFQYILSRIVYKTMRKY